MSRLKALVKQIVPSRWRRFVRVHAKRVWPPIGLIRFGSLRRLTPIAAAFGERGQPIDRYYVERFLRRQSGQEDYVLGDIRGHTLEIGDDFYSRMFGHWGDPERTTIEKLDVLSADAAAPEATIIGDLGASDNLPADTFDCVICTQTLLLIYDVRAAIATLHRILKPGGVLLATVPGISPVCRPDINLWGDHWRFTSLSMRRLFEERFDPADVSVEAHGNVLAAVAFLHRLGSEELKQEELDLNDPDFELVITVRARKQRA
jgi:SAM-dependent methyltransferase